MAIVQFVARPEQAEARRRATRSTREPAELAAGRRLPCQFRDGLPGDALADRGRQAARLDPDRVVVPGKPPEAVALLADRASGCTGGLTFAELELDRLRFYLDGEAPSPTRSTSCSSTTSAGSSIRGRGGATAAAATAIALPPGVVRPVGFEPRRGDVPLPGPVVPGYRLLQEFFAFPEKFLFFDLTGPGPAGRRAGSGETVDLCSS